VTDELSPLAKILFDQCSEMARAQIAGDGVALVKAQVKAQLRVQELYSPNPDTDPAERARRGGM